MRGDHTQSAIHRIVRSVDLYPLQIMWLQEVQNLINVRKVKIHFVVFFKI